MRLTLHWKTSRRSRCLRFLFDFVVKGWSMENIGVTVSIPDLSAIRDCLQSIVEPEIVFSLSSRESYTRAIKEMQSQAEIALEILHMPLTDASQYDFQKTPPTSREVIERAKVRLIDTSEVF
jgi:hypothetical protein